jgi:hypothetical protein
MNILRDDLMVALNSLYVACDTSANHMRGASETAVEYADLSEALDSFARTRLEWSETISELIKEAGDIPRHPAGEAALVDQLLTGLKATFSIDEVQALLDSCAEADQGIVDAADSALEQEPESGLRKRLADIREQAAVDVDDLRQQYL